MEGTLSPKKVNRQEIACILVGCGSPTVKRISNWRKNVMRRKAGKLNGGKADGGQGVQT